MSVIDLRNFYESVSTITKKKKLVITERTFDIVESVLMKSHNNGLIEDTALNDYIDRFHYVLENGYLTEETETFIDDIKYLRDVNTYLEETEWSTKNRYPVFVVLQHSGTPMANVIKAVTRDEFSHACISFNPDLKPMYSFGAKDKTTTEDGKKKFFGFITQSPDSDLFRHFKAKYAVYVMYIDKKTIDEMKKKIYWFINNDKDLSYSFAGLITCGLGKKMNIKNKYFCSQFVMTILQTACPGLKDPSVWKPQDLAGLQNITLVNEGDDFTKYDKKITLKNMKKIRDHEEITDFKKDEKTEQETKKKD